MGPDPCLVDTRQPGSLPGKKGNLPPCRSRPTPRSSAATLSPSARSPPGVSINALATELGVNRNTLQIWGPQIRHRHRVRSADTHIGDRCGTHPPAGAGSQSAEGRARYPAQGREIFCGRDETCDRASGSLMTLRRTIWLSGYARY